MADVTIHRVSLCGFGLYRETVNFRFAPSLSVMVGENETGKSTLVSGILATLFGLRGEDDPSRFTVARFRNWDSPAGFRGELEFTASGRLYCLRRDFETHEVLFVRDDEGAGAPEFQGRHNPAGRGPEVTTYHEALKRVFGVADPEVFEHVFCVRQDAERSGAPGVSGSVQQLVAGSGERSLEDVVLRLVNAVQRITRRMRDHDVLKPGLTRPTDLREDRDLEIIEREIEAARGRIDVSGTTLASLAGMRATLAGKQESLARSVDESKEVKRTLEAWKRWDTLRREIDSREKEQSRLVRVISRHDEFRSGLEEARRSSAEDFPEFKDAPPDLSEKLDEMIGVLERGVRARQEKEAIEMGIGASFGEGVLSDQKPEDLLQRLGRKVDLEADLEAKAQELQQIEVEFSQAREGRRRKAVVLGFVGFVAGLALGLALGWEAPGMILLMLSAGIVVGGITFLVIRPKVEDPRAVERFKSLNRAIVAGVGALADVNQALENLGSVHAGPLGELREKLRRLVKVSGDAAKAEDDASRHAAGLRAFLTPTQGDAARAKDRYAEFQKRMRSFEEYESKMDLLLNAEGANSLEDLSARKTRLDNVVQNLITEEKALRQEHHFLELASRAESSLELEKEQGALESKADALARAIETEEGEIGNLENDIDRLEGEDLVDVASEEIRLREMEAERDQLVLDRDALVLAYRVTRDAIAGYQSSYRDRLGQSIHHSFATLTGRADRGVRLDEKFTACVREAAGQACATEQLSHGAQDQLHLAIRLAVAEMISGEVKIPFIFDDPFLTFDAERLEILRSTLTEISESRQVILLTHREDWAGWGAPVEKH